MNNVNLVKIVIVAAVLVVVIFIIYKIVKWLNNSVKNLGLKRTLFLIAIAIFSSLIYLVVTRFNLHDKIIGKFNGVMDIGIDKTTNILESFGVPHNIASIVPIIALVGLLIFIKVKLKKH